MTPYEKRMKESAERKSRILRLHQNGLTPTQIAGRAKCSRAYVHQVIKETAK